MIKVNKLFLTGAVRVCIGLALPVLVLASQATGQTRTFDAGGNGTSWTDPANWSDDNAPDSAAESASIDAGGAFDVDLNSTLTIANLTVGADDSLTVSSGNLTVNGTATTPGTVTINGFGTFITSGAWTNTGTVVFDAYTLAGANGVFTNAPTGTLAGSAYNGIGYVGSEFHNEGTISPGFGPGDGKYLTIATTTYLEPTSILDIEIGGIGNTNVDFDQLYTPTSIFLGGTLNVSLFNGYTPTPLSTYAIVSGYMTDATGEFANVADGQRIMTLGGEGSFLVTYDIDNNYVALSDFQPVPEPATAVLLLPAALALYRRRA
ncbi:MAG: hypothetical protein R3C45_14610 [Phycisphaerales bacterium]